MDGGGERPSAELEAQICNALAYAPKPATDALLSRLKSAVIEAKCDFVFTGTPLGKELPQIRQSKALPALVEGAATARAAIDANGGSKRNASLAARVELVEFIIDPSTPSCARHTFVSWLSDLGAGKFIKSDFQTLRRVSCRYSCLDKRFGLLCEGLWCRFVDKALEALDLDIAVHGRLTKLLYLVTPRMSLKGWLEEWSCSGVPPLCVSRARCRLDALETEYRRSRRECAKADLAIVTSELSEFGPVDEAYEQRIHNRTLACMREREPVLCDVYIAVPEAQHRPDGFETVARYFEVSEDRLEHMYAESLALYGRCRERVEND